MVAARKHPPARKLTEDEYLTLEQVRVDERFEYVDGVLRAMSGTTRKHNVIVQNLVLKLTPVAREKRCRTTAESVKLRAPVGSGRLYYYPDFMVVCNPETPDPYTEENPCLVVEVLSKSTTDVDRGEKLETYQRLKSVQTYAIVDQERRKVEVYSRIADGWLYRLLEGDARMDVPCLETSIALDDVYRDVTFPALNIRKPKPPARKPAKKPVKGKR